MGEGGASLERKGFPRNHTYEMVREAILSGISNATDRKRVAASNNFRNAVESAKMGAGGTIFRAAIKEGGDFNSGSAINTLKQLSMVVAPGGNPRGPGYGTEGRLRTLEEALGGEDMKTFLPINEYETRRDTRGMELIGLSATVTASGGRANFIEIKANPQALAKLRGEQIGGKTSNARAAKI